MKNTRKLLALATAIAMTVLTACGTPEVSPPASGQGTSTAALGRYVERDCALPVTPMGMLGLHRDGDGMVSFFAAHQGAESWELFTSTDGGESWSTAEQGLISAAKLTQVDAVCPKPDGGILVAGTYYSPEFEKQLEEFQAKGGGYSEEFDWPPPQVMDVSPDGTVREIPIKLPAQAAGNISRMAIAPSGELALQSYNEIYRYDSETGELLGTISTSAPIDSITFGGDKLAAMSNGIATLYDFESGDPLETIDQLGYKAETAGQLTISSTDDQNPSLVATGEDGAFYFCNSTGIYRRTLDGNLVERVVDGALVSLGTPSVELLGMAVIPNGFLVAMTVNNSVMVKKYAFDPTVPTLPDKALRIFSLSESKTIRQAIGDYQRLHPDTHVVLEVAPAGLSAAEAVRTLNTELLAGKGPDLLVLDGMPVDSYLEKGVLLPLDEGLTEGTLANITGVGRGSGGKLYFVPTRFSLPVIAADDSIPQELDTIGDLVDGVIALGEAQKNNAVSSLLQNCGGEMLLNTLYPVYAHTLQTNGKPDKEKLTDFLYQLKRITELQDQSYRFLTDASPTATLDLEWNVLNWAMGVDALGVGNLRSFRDFANASTAAEMVEGGRVQPLGPEGVSIFTPLTVLGVSVGSQSPESAVDFIRIALSAPVQDYDFRDGLPVNSQALNRLLTRDQEGVQLGAYGMTDEDGVTRVVNIQYPTPEAWQELRGWTEALDTPTRDNQVLLELLRSETVPYFNGTDSLEATMNTLWQKLTLLDAE